MSAVPPPPAPEGGGTSRVPATIAIVAVVVALIVAVAVVLATLDGDDEPAASPSSSAPPTSPTAPASPGATDDVPAEQSPVPAGVTDDFGIVHRPGTGGADRITVVLYEDFLCPACGAFEAAAGDFLRDAADDGEISIEYRPFAFLHQASTNDYAARAWNAAACVNDASGPDAFTAFHDLLFQNQPLEGGDGPEDAELVDLAEQAGVTGIDACIGEQTFTPWVEAALDRGRDDGVSGTPTVRIDGQDVAGPGNTIAGVEDLRAAIDAARAGQTTTT
ncbi:MAG: thioredoxin domain-containing protein [Aeromicrobium sp.]